MREPILKAVANPPKILWGPYLPVLLNLGLQFPMMFAGLGMFEINPLFFVATIGLAHTGIVLWGAKEPHISNMIQAFGTTFRVTNNLLPKSDDLFCLNRMNLGFLTFCLLINLCPME